MTKKKISTWHKFLGILFLLTGCASTEEIIRTDADPLENFNRAMFDFNDTLDKALLKPVAQGYEYLLPDFVNQGITNFFNNLDEGIVIVHDVLQLKPKQTLVDTTRLVYNSIFGLGGFIDVATPMGLPKNQQDFGITLGRWGIGEGYYLILPFLGPTTTRDIWSTPADIGLDPIRYVPIDLAVSIGLWTVKGVDIRADLLRVERAFAGAQIDPYSFQRQAYLQNRRNLVYEGNPPKLKLEFEEE